MIIFVQLDEVHAEFFLPSDLGLDGLEANRSEVVEVHSDIVHRGCAHVPDTFGIAASLAGFVGVHVSKQMPSAVIQLSAKTQ